MNKFPSKIRFLLKNIRYLSVVKIINLFKLRFDYIKHQLLKNNYKSNFPSFLSIELCNYCNLQCPECPVGRSMKSNQKKENLDFDLFTKLIDELKKQLLHVNLYFQGEPFLHPNWFEFVQKLQLSKIHSTISTNGQYNSKKHAENIVKSKLDKLIVAIDGTTQEVYEKYRIGGQLSRAIECIESVNYWKKKLNSITPYVEIQFLVLKTNEHQISDIKKLAKKLGVNNLSLKTAQLYDFEDNNPRLTTLNKFSRYKLSKEGKYILKAKQANRCWRMWSGAVVNTKGEVLPCCFDKNAEHVFGNINKETFSQCWNTKKAFSFRENILLDRKQFDICRNCTSK